jgi:hypothetical protein
MLKYNPQYDIYSKFCLLVEEEWLETPVVHEWLFQVQCINMVFISDFIQEGIAGLCLSYSTIHSTELGQMIF